MRADDGAAAARGVAAGPRRLCKARDRVVVDGVCSGVAEYLGMGVTTVRVGFVLLALAGLWGALLYVLGMVLIPRSPSDGEAHAPADAVHAEANPLWVAGMGFVILGAVLFLREIGIYQWRFWRVWMLGFHATWPLFVIAAGTVLVARANDIHRREPRLVRPDEDRMVAGVSSALARWLGVDASVIRVLWAFFTVLSFGVGALAYGIAVLLIPESYAEVPDVPGLRGRMPEKAGPPVSPGPSVPPGH
jgi:phage shock protein PspC (stress-responsive transcriptional regulator)